MTSRQIIEEYIAAMTNNANVDEVMERYISDQDMELKGHIQVFQAGMPGYYLEPQDIISEGSKVVVRFKLKGRHTGDLFGYPPSGNAVDVSGIIIYEVEGGKIVNHWMEADSVGLMQQISPKVATEA
jgi:predicted ester cyclase